MYVLNIQASVYDIRVSYSMDNLISNFNGQPTAFEMGQREGENTPFEAGQEDEIVLYIPLDQYDVKLYYAVKVSVTC